MTVTVVVPTVRPTTVRASIESIRRQTYTDLEIIVVAQGNDPALRSVTDDLARSDPRIRIVWLEQGNLSAARNAGISAGTGEIVAITDDDCEADSRWVELMVEIFRTRPDIGFVGGQLVAAPSLRRFSISTCPAAHVQETSYQPSKSGWEAPPGFYVIGANLSMRRSVFEKVGLFDPTLGAGTRYGSCEDVDYVLRCELKDIGILSTPRLIIYHTYGRRYGLMSCLKHHRNYNYGRGAFAVKLRWMKHRLAPIWCAPGNARHQLKSLLRNPAKWAVDEVYGRYFQIKASREYAEKYELTSESICAPRRSSAT